MINVLALRRPLTSRQGSLYFEGMDPASESSSTRKTSLVPLRTIIISLITGCVFFAAMAGQILTYVPGLYCENFGCIVHGIIYVVMGLAIPVVYAICAAIKSKVEKLRAFLTSMIIMALCIGGAFAAMSAVNQSRIKQGYKDAEEACREYPQLCPDK